MRGRASSTRARLAPVGAAVLLCLGLAHCSDSSRVVDPRYGVSASPRLVQSDEPVPKGGGVYRVGSPYTVAGRVYVPEVNPNYQAEGLASWYGSDFHGRSTANGEIFDLDAISAAHPTMPLPSYARVTNLTNGRSIIVRVNDRGPYHGNRIIDVSKKAAHLLAFHDRGTVPVRVEYVGAAPMQGSDDRILEATLRTNQPAPAPGTFKLAAAPIAPSAPEPSTAGTRYASASLFGRPAEPTATGGSLFSFAPTPSGTDGTDQFLNGRGLY